MFLDVLIATAISSLVFLGLFALTDDTLRATHDIRAIALGQRALITLESRRRLAHVNGSDNLVLGQPACPASEVGWLDAWCQHTESTFAGLGHSVTLCLNASADVNDGLSARLILGYSDCAGDSPDATALTIRRELLL